MRNSRVHQTVMGLLALCVLALSSCEKLKTAAAKLSKAEAKEAGEPAAKAVYSPNQISNITPSSYADFIKKSNVLVVVDFHAEWCGPCKVLAPVLARATELNPGVVYLGKMDVDQAGDFPGKQGVQGIPDVRIFKNGKEVDRFVGFPGEAAVLDRIAKHAQGILPSAPALASPEPTVKPFSKDWLPPGMSRKGEDAPIKDTQK